MYIIAHISRNLSVIFGKSSKAYHNNEAVKIFGFKKVYLRVHTMLKPFLCC